MYVCVCVAFILFIIFFCFVFCFLRSGLRCLKQKQYVRLSNEVKYKNATTYSTKYRACGIIYISKYSTYFLSTNRTTLILSSLVGEI